MISGEYKHTMDPKNRMVFPAKLREKLGDVVVLMKSTDPCISVYPLSAWQAFSEKLESMPQAGIRDLKRFLYSSVDEQTLDGQGRVVIPAALKEWAKLEKNVTTIGVGDHAEIWDETLLAERIGSIDPAEIAEKLIELGL